MKKGVINNNLDIFNNKYHDLFIDITKDCKKKQDIINLSNDLSYSPKELIDFCYYDFCKMPINSNVLILGGGYGGEANRIKLQYKEYNLYTLDKSPWGEKVGLEIIQNVNFITGDMCDIKFDNDFFDIVLSMHSLEHTSDIDKTMSEIYRVIKDNGIFGLSYPYKWQTDEQHVYMFEDDIVEYMSKYGEVKDAESKEHQSRMLRIIINKSILEKK